MFFSFKRLVTSNCIGFVWQRFGSRGLHSKVASHRRHPCLIVPMPAVSKMDPPLAKAKPISDGGSTSVVT